MKYKSSREVCPYSRGMYILEKLSVILTKADSIYDFLFAFPYTEPLWNSENDWFIWEYFILFVSSVG